MKTKFRDLINKTAKDLDMDETVVNNIVRFHWNRAFELYNTLDYWTIYIENVGTLWTTNKKCMRYKERLEGIKQRLMDKPELFKIYTVEDIPEINRTIEKVEGIRQIAYEAKGRFIDITRKRKLKDEAAISNP